MQKSLLLAASALTLLATAATAQAPAALMGTVTSAKDGAMEGVVVSAKKEGSTIAVSVASDSKGHYSFPAAKLEPGHYTLKIRAVGYDLDHAVTTDVKSGVPTTADLKLAPNKNLSAQLTN